MEGKRQLVLRHLVDAGFLEDDTSEQIMSMLSPDVAATIAVSVVSCFTPKGELQTLDSRAKFDWILHIIGYSLSLPTFFQDSLVRAISVVKLWMTEGIGHGNEQERNEYARRMLRYVSNVFDYTEDDDNERRARLMIVIMNDLGTFTRSCQQWYDAETYTVLIKIVLGTADFLMQPAQKAAFSKTSLDLLLRRIFVVLFDSLCISKLRSDDIWELFTQCSKKWCESLPYVVAWRAKVYEVFQEMCSGSADELVGFQLKQLIQAIDNEVVFASELLFCELSGLIQDLCKVCKDSCVKIGELYHPMYPISVYFQLFGRWVFSPFQKEQNAGHLQIVRTIFDMCSSMHFPVGSPWIPVVMRVVDLALKATEPGAVVNALGCANQLLNRFYSNALCARFTENVKAFAKFQGAGIPTSGDFWRGYASLLNVLSERQRLDDEVLRSFVSQSTDLNSLMSVLLIVLRQNPAAFCEMAAHQYKSDSAITGTLNCVIASYMPFVDFDDMNKLFLVILESASRHREAQNVIHSFLILLCQYVRFSNKLAEVINPVIDFLYSVFCQQDATHLHLFHVARKMLGRPFRKPSTDIKAKIAFMVADSSIVTVLEDETVEVRDARGCFAWNLEECLGTEIPTLGSTEFGELPPPPSIQVREIASNYVPQGVVGIDDIKAKLANGDVATDYRVPANFHQMEYLKKFVDAPADREKIVNFVVESGIYQRVRKLQDPVSEVLAKYDAISDVALIDIGLVHMDGSGITSSGSDRFTSMRSILGTRHHMGVIELQFVEGEPRDDMEAIVIFAETPLHLDLEHSTAPKAQMTVIIQPFDAEHVKVRFVCPERKPLYWNAIESFRLVHVAQILPTILSALFRFYEIKNRELFFVKDKERQEFLKSVETHEMVLLQTVQKGAFSVELSAHA